MRIQLHHIIPFPLKDSLTSSQVWGQDITLETNKNYKVDAPSGKGKSTFVHILYGLRNDYEGQLTIDGTTMTDITHDDVAAIRRSKVSIVFQDLRLFPKLTARDNIILNAFGEDVSDRIQKYAELLGVTRLLDKPSGILSYGEQQRIAIIRALIQPFDFLLLDEPFSHLDDKNIAIACKLINEVCEDNNAGFLIASLGHDYQLKYDEVLTL